MEHVLLLTRCNTLREILRFPDALGSFKGIEQHTKSGCTRTASVRY